MHKALGFEKRYSELSRETNKATGAELIRLKNKKIELDKEYLEWHKTK